MAKRRVCIVFEETTDEKVLTEKSGPPLRDWRDPKKKKEGVVDLLNKRAAAFVKSNYLDPPPSVNVLPVASPEPIAVVSTEDERVFNAFQCLIDNASELSPPANALSKLTGLASTLDTLTARCVARLRLRLPVVHLAQQEPQWLQEQREELTRSGQVAEEALVTACRLVAEVSKVCGAHATLEPTSMARVRVEWEHSSDLRWIVTPIELPWPGACVRLYVPDESQNLQAETHYLASVVIERSLNLLK